MPTPVERHQLQDLAWEDLVLMLVAAERGSLGGAARALRVSQSTASRRLQRLEHRLSARLFDRTPEGLAPTALTLELIPHVRLMEGHMADLLRVAAGQEATPSGTVRLALPDGLASSWLMPHLPELYARHPGVLIDLTIGPAVVDLVRGEAELALRFVPSSGADLIELPLGALPLAPYAHARLACQPISSLRWLALPDPRRAFQETRWLDTHAPHAPRMTVNLWNALFAGVQAGVGAGILSPMVAEPAGLVRLRPDLPPPEPRLLRLVFHRALRRVPRVRVVVDWLSERARDFLVARGDA